MSESFLSFFSSFYGEIIFELFKAFTTFKSWSFSRDLIKFVILLSSWFVRTLKAETHESFKRQASRLYFHKGCEHSESKSDEA